MASEDTILKKHLSYMGITTYEPDKAFPVNVLDIGAIQNLWVQFQRLSYVREVRSKPASKLVKTYHIATSFISTLQKLGIKEAQAFDLIPQSRELLSVRLRPFVNTVKNDLRRFGLSNNLLRIENTEFTAHPIIDDNTVNAGLGFTVEGTIELKTRVKELPLNTVLDSLRNKLYDNGLPTLLQDNDRSVEKQKASEKLYWYSLRLKDDYEFKVTRCKDTLLARYVIRVSGSYYYGNDKNRLDILADIWSDIFTLNN